MKKLTRSLNGSGSAFVLGHRSANRDCYNLRQAPLGSLSMGSRTYRDPMVHDGLPSRNLEILLVCPAAILVSTGWICLRIRIMKVWNQNCFLRSSMCYIIIIIIIVIFILIFLSPLQRNRRVRTRVIRMSGI